MSAGQQTIERMAYHEAGHAVAAFALGGRVNSIAITHDGDASDARCGAPDSDEIEIAVRSRDRDRVERVAILMCAGAVAEQRHAGRRSRQASRDLRQVNDLLALVSGSAEQRRAYAAWLLVRAKDLIASRWRDVDRLAKELLEVDSMSDRRLREFLKAMIQERLAAASAPLKSSR